MKRLIFILSFIFLISLTISSCGSNRATGEKIADTMTQNDDNNLMPKPKPAPKIHFKKPEVFKLDNGLTVIIVENHKLPRVNTSLRIDNQPVPLRDKKGTDDLLQRLLGTGSNNISKDEFNKKIDFYGARVFFNDNGFFINSLSKFFPEILNLTADQVLNPNFTKEEFVKEQEKLIEELKIGEKSTPETAKRVMKKLSFGKHPYGELTLINNVKKIELNDVIKYYKNNFNPNKAYLIIVGDIDKEQAKNLAEKNFGNWKKAPITKGLSLPRIENAPTTEVDFVHMPNAEQTEIKVTQRSDLRLNNPDYQKVLLMNSILGGDFNSYLNMTLREKHGWTYGARSHFGTDKYGDLFTASTSVRNSVADSAVVVTMKQINKIINQKVSDTLLYNNKQKFMGKFVLDMENISTIANQAYNIFVNNLPEDYYETFLQKIDAVTVNDIQEVAKKYLHPENMRVIVAGNAHKTVPGLEKAGFKIKFFDKHGNPTKAPDLNRKLPENINVKTVIDNYIKAIGGKQKIQNVQSLIAVYTTQMQGMEITNTIQAMKPNLSSNVVTGMGMTLSKEVFDGEKGFKEVQGQKKAYTEEEITKAKNTLMPFPDLNLVKTGKLDRVENIDGTDYYVIIDDEQTEYFFNSKTGLKDKEVKHIKVQGKEMSQPIEFSNYTEIDGVKIPGKVSIKMGMQELEFKLKEAKINSLTKEDFK